MLGFYIDSLSVFCMLYEHCIYMYMYIHVYSVCTVNPEMFAHH